MQKKILLSILAIVTLLTTCVVMSVAASAAEKTISSVEEFMEFMNGGQTEWSAGNTYTLTKNIDLTGQTQQPIGRNSSTAYFNGTFDGDGHTIRGIDINVTDGANNVGLFGMLNGGTIQNLTVEGTVTSTGGHVGGLVGGSVGGTIINCTNKCTVNGSSATKSENSGNGGIIGFAAPSKAITIDGCTNEGAINGTFSGGIVGYVGNHSGSLKILRCKNTGTITAAGQYCGGIVAYLCGRNADKSTLREVAYCWNDGRVIGYTSGNADVGGIIGYLMQEKGVNTIHDNLNTGTISGNDRVGGCFGVFFSCSATQTVVAYNLNKGTVNGTTAARTGDVVGFPSSKSGHDNYFITDTVHTNTFSGTVQGVAYTADAFATLNTNNAWVVAASPELSYFHVHTLTYTDNGDGTHKQTCTACGDAKDVAHTYEDGYCTFCHAEEPACQHDGTTHEVVTLAATCVATGLKNVVCDKCEQVIDTVVLPIDANNHAAGYGLYLDHNKNAKGEIDYCCSFCDGVVVEDTSNVSDVYVSASGYEITPANVSAGNLLGTSARPFANFKDAMDYAGLATKAMKVHIKDSAVAPASYSSPICSHLITITGGELNFNTAPRRFFAYGDITFENITFKTEETATTANAVGGVFFFGQNHNFTFGEGIVMGNADAIANTGFASTNNVKAYVFGGFGDGAATPSTMNTHLTIRSGDYWFIGGWNRSTSTTKGTAHITVGKTNAGDTLQTKYLVPFSTSTQYLSADSVATILVDGDIDVQFLYIGNQVDGTADKSYTTNYVLKGNISPNYPSYNGGLGFDITGWPANKTGANNVYVDERVSTAIVDSYAFFGDGASVSADTAVKTMGYPTTYYTYVQYCANVLGGHTLSGDTCTRCGAEHVGTIKAWAVDSENGGYKLVCSGCGKVFATGVAEPVVYVDNNTARNSFVGDDNNDGLTAETAVNTLNEAITRLTATGGRVYISDRYVISNTITLPAHDKMITIQSVLSESGGNLTGFLNMGHGAIFNMNGPITFEHITFNSELTDTATRSGTYYKILTLAANWNDFTMGDGVIAYGGFYFVVGNSQTKVNSGDETKTVNIQLNRVTAGTTRLPDASSDTGYKSGATPFYERIYLMDRYNGDGLVTKNKTVNATFYNITATNVYYATTSSATQNAQMENCALNLTIGKKGDDMGTGVFITRLFADNNLATTTGAAYLDNFTLNINDNVSKIGTISIYNVKNATLNISKESDGRTVPFAFNIAFHQSSAYNSGAGADVTETVTANYGTHSFSVGKALTVDDTYTLNENVTDECTWDTDVKNATATLYTCTVCGREKTSDSFVYDADAFARPHTQNKTTKEIMSYLLRIIVRAYVPEDKTVEYYGIAMLPQNTEWTFEDGKNYVVKRTADTDPLVSGTTFSADIENIPVENMTTDIFAWAFVKYEGEDVVTVPIGTYNVQDYMYTVEG